VEHPVEELPEREVLVAVAADLAVPAAEVVVAGEADQL
jgi:hypothetical protein